MTQEIQSHIHNQICEKQEYLKKWFQAHRKNKFLPIYSSVDIRNANFKVASVDSNLYPAGFNNICDVDRESAIEIANNYLGDAYKDVENILILTEEHTKNAFYWQNVKALKDILSGQGRNIRLAMPKEMETTKITSSNGDELEVFSAARDGDSIKLIDGFVPDLVISNNDFSVEYAEWGEGLKTPMNPPREMGWYQRSKAKHFEYYNKLATEFAGILQVDPFLFRVETDFFESENMSSQESKDALAAKVGKLLVTIKDSYKERGINQEPTVFIKNDSGTYGLAVNQVKSAAEVLEWNNKARTKMKAAKGGNKVEKYILQEGIPTSVKSDGAMAEPAIYLMGCELIGGFLRAHASKGENESLNSPGAVYKRLCVSDLKVKLSKCPQENVYGWVARLSSLAQSYEMKDLGISSTSDL